MKKWTVLLGLVVAMAVLATGVAYAQGEEPPHGGLRGRRLNADPQLVRLELQGGIHDDLLAAVSEATGLSVSDLESRIEGGETLAAILEAEDFDPEILAEIMFEVRQAALQELVEAGTISQDQADWMLERQMNGARSFGDCSGEASQIRQHGGGFLGRGAARGDS
jgi:hypothetical protein